MYETSRDIFRGVGQGQQLGYVSVLLAELLMMLGNNAEAESELLAALPVIERLELRREAMAAVSLLRRAMARQRADLRSIRAVRDQLRRMFH